MGTIIQEKKLKISNVKGENKRYSFQAPSTVKEEIDLYKDEMGKNEDYMKKALMRGVCALNMEAMSMFNETIGKNRVKI